MSLAPLRLLRTVRHLRVRQLGHQLLKRLPERFALGDPGETAPPLRWRPGSFPLPAIAAIGDAQQILGGAMRFLNRREDLGFPPAWDRDDVPPLWRYNLHYHDFLWALPFDAARHVALDWIAGHRPGGGQIGWAPYPLSLRLGNWCALFFGRRAAETAADAGFRQALWVSIRDQANHLESNLERHLMANHLLENAVALALAGSCFDHPAAARWRRKGRALLEAELAEQVLPDGGHFERSPMYQCRVLYALKLLDASGDAALRALVAPYSASLAQALAVMTHPDGGIALLNDSAFGIYPTPGELGCRTPLEGAFALPDTGYYGARNGRGDYVICDAAPLGPDYQPGHGHADLYTFELSLAGARVIVDSGVSTYEPGAMRDYCRSTRAHNTVTVRDRDQAELWGAFRVGRRCRPHDIEWQPSESGFVLAAEHDGYRHLRRSPIHARRFRWQQTGRLTITDRVTAKAPVESVARLHFHPDVEVTMEGTECRLRFAGGEARVFWRGWEHVALKETVYCPEFGMERTNRCLTLSSAVAALRGEVEIETARPV